MLKLQDVERFATMFLGYDLLARRWLSYGYVYPLLELGAGALMLARLWPLAVDPGGAAIGGIGAVSVVKAVYIDGRELKCACVGGSGNVRWIRVADRECHDGGDGVVDGGRAVIASRHPLGLGGGSDADVGGTGSGGGKCGGPCPVPPGAEALWRPSIRYLLIGGDPRHGGDTGRFRRSGLRGGAKRTAGHGRGGIIVGRSAVVDAFLASNGDAKARAALLTLPILHDAWQDGRSSTAFLALFERLRVLQQAGRSVASSAAMSARISPRESPATRSWRAIGRRFHSAPTDC